LSTVSTTPRTWPGATGQVLVLQHHDDIPANFVGERLAQLGARLDVIRTARPTAPDPRQYDLVLSLGSYDSAFDYSLPYVRRERQLLSAAVESGVPVLGICFGAQALALTLGGSVRRAPLGPEIGWLRVHAPTSARPRGDLARVGRRVVPGPWLVWHHDEIEAPAEAITLARTPASLQAFRQGPHLGLQFHPEATTTSIERWVAQDKAGLRDSGVDPARLLAESAQHLTSARRRAYQLTDAFLSQSLVGAG
jgi:GMP synthase (glutamine-hydrolysing)